MEVAETLSLAQRIAAIKVAHEPAPTISFFDDAMGKDLVHSMIELPGVPGVGFGTGPNLSLIHI